MDTQTAYEMMRVYLTRPGARRAFTITKSGSEWCAYETQMDGEIHRCAVGCLLSPTALDEEGFAGYMGDIDQVWDEGALFWLVKDELADIEFDFLRAAQEIHDSESNWEGGYFHVEKLDQLAAEFELEVVKEVAARATQEAVLV